jgi:deoxyribonucleoside regulator
MSRGLINDRETMVRTCKLYYLENRTQSEIAKIMGISRPQVSRLLTEARKEGIVKIEINADFANTVTNISEDLKKKYSLKNVVVADENLSNGTIPSIASAAAGFLSGYIKDGQIIGISWGRTLYETVEKIVFNGKYINTTFVPLIGGVGQMRHEYQMNTIVEKISNAFHSNRYYLFAPAFLESSKTLQMMLEDNSIKSVVEIWNKLDVAIVGIGEPISLSNAFRNIYDKNFLASLLKQSAVGDIAARFFTASGEPCKFESENILGISLEQIKKVPEVIGIAGGKEKAAAIHAAIKARYISSLVTDNLTAMQLMNMEE